MTLVIGIIAKDGFVIASDSRASSMMSSSDSADKFFPLNDDVVVGIAGDGNIATHVFDRIKEEDKIDFKSSISVISERISEEFSAYFNKYFPDIAYQDRARLQILLAGYSKDTPRKPHLYTLDSDDNFVPRQSTPGHFSLGTFYVSEYLLNRIYVKDKMSSAQAAKLSIFCLRETSLQNQKVGGAFKVGTFSTTQPFTLMSNAEIKTLFNQCKNKQDTNKNWFYPEEMEGSLPPTNPAT
jgi:20S proteasome alpha/beta subunit